MRIGSVIALLSILISLFSCRDNRAPEDQASDVQRYYYPDGPLYMEVHVKDDSIPHGLSVEYFRSGQIYQQAEYANGKKHGSFKRFYEDGKLALESSYDSGRREGVERKYRKDGTLAYEAPYIKDQPTIGLKEYYTDGQLIRDVGKIEFKEENRKSEGRFSLLVFYTGPYKAEFFSGRLSEGKYIGRECKKLQVDRDGVSRVDYPVGVGEFLATDIDIIAKVKTDLKNFHIIQTRYEVTVDNR